MTSRTRTTLVLLAVFVAYIGVMLPLDLSLDLVEQSVWSLTTWAFLGIGLYVSLPHERAQVIAMVGVATCAELTASVLLGVYTYRLDNLPLFVPPGHGLFYLMALRASELPLLARHGRAVSLVILGGATLLAIAGVVRPQGVDVLGLASWGVLLPFLLTSRHRLLFAVSFTMTMALEFYGTGLGNWTWAATVPILGIAAGNPPACIGAGYCCMDRIARYLAPRLESWMTRVRPMMRGAGWRDRAAAAD